MSDAGGQGAEPPRRAPLVERLLPPVDQLGDDGQPKPSRMTPQEQLVTAGLGCANVAIAAGAASVMQSGQAAALVAGLLASALSVAGARVGNRMVAMLGLFTCVVTRFSNTAVFVAFGLPYYGAALWMFFKYNRLTKAQATLRRQQRAESRASSPRRAGRSSGKASASTSIAKRPTASKRYTPPKPVKKRPPPPEKPPRDRSPVD